MTDCCSSPKCTIPHPNKHRCPVNGKEYAEVPEKTVIHHIKQVWQQEPGSCRYFFCDDSACDVVYFGDDDSVVLKSQLRTLVGAKEASNDALVCYCFGVTKADALRDSKARDYVVSRTKQGLCSCETSNPSGRCCLKGFPRSKDSE
ncbi:putative iron-sulfur cluster-binding metallochaperone [Sulfuricella denitrificans]|uniref:putative iron-sulfur cluster-binding metallochaperone n=1 Tax=Sulfuricella denitrificans TaxID=649841 RepID=UPI0038CD4E84